MLDTLLGYAQVLPGVATQVAPYFAGYAALFLSAWILGPRLFPSCAALDDPGRGYWSSSAMSMVNGFILSYMCLTECASSGIHLTSDFHFTTPSSYRIVHCLLGYILVDLCALLKWRKAWKPWVYFLHHGLAIWGYVACSAHGICHNCAVPVVLAEGTAPFANGRWFLSTAKLKQTTLYNVNGVMILVSWFFLRVYLLGWLGWQRLHVQSDTFFALGQPTVAAFLTCFALGYALQVWRDHTLQKESLSR
jgi:hypothetical protein